MRAASRREEEKAKKERAKEGSCKGHASSRECNVGQEVSMEASQGSRDGEGGPEGDV